MKATREQELFLRHAFKKMMGQLHVAAASHVSFILEGIQLSEFDSRDWTNEEMDQLGKEAFLRCIKVFYKHHQGQIDVLKEAKNILNKDIDDDEIDEETDY